MNNPKVGDVKIIKPSIDSSQDTLNEILLTLVDAVNELNGHTPVKPEKTLEEKEEHQEDNVNVYRVLDITTANTVTAVLDEVESEARDLYLESDDENYQRALTDIIENVVKPLYGKE